MRESILLATTGPQFFAAQYFFFVSNDNFIYIGDIESNLGPRRSDCSCNFLLKDWCLNSMTEQNLWKINLFEAYNTIGNFDAICLLDILDTKGHGLYRVSHPDNVNRGGACVYIRQSIPILFSLWIYYYTYI